MNKMKYIGKKILAVILVLIGFPLLSIGNYSMFGIILGTCFFIAGGTIWVTASTKEYNQLVSTVNIIEGAELISIRNLYDNYQGMNTNYGKCWLGSIKGIKGECLIFGPGIEDEFVYVYKKKDKLYVGVSESTSWITGPEQELWRMQEQQSVVGMDYREVLCYVLEAQAMVQELRESIEKFVKTHEVANISYHKESERLYRFDEEFKLTGQRFKMCDMDGNGIYLIEGTIPLKTFTISDIQTEQEVFRVTKRIIHVLPHYDFYLREEKYGSFEKKLSLSHDIFTMETRDGTLEMKDERETFGHNYLVKLNGKIIGSIAEKLNLTIVNFVFDNFVIYVRDEKYAPLMAALGVMAARELQRDEN